MAYNEQHLSLPEISEHANQPSGYNFPKRSFYCLCTDDLFLSFVRISVCIVDVPNCMCIYVYHHYTIL